MAELTCGATLAKYILFVFNFIFWAFGAALLGVGIWLKVDPTAANYARIIELNSNNSLINGALIAILIIGIIIFVVGFFGCCGACQESACMLNMYAICLGILVILQIVAGILAIVYRDQISNGLENSMSEQANEHVKYQQDYKKSDAITLAWHVLQSRLSCCGGRNGSDYINSVYRQGAVNASASSTYVPFTCCVMEDKYSDPPKPVDTTKCQTESQSFKSSQYYHHEGCYTKLMDWIRKHAGILIGIALGVVGIEILGIVLACCVRKQILEQKDFQ